MIFAVSELPDRKKITQHSIAYTNPNILNEKLYLNGRKFVLIQNPSTHKCMLCEYYPEPSKIRSYNDPNIVPYTDEEVFLINAFIEELILRYGL